MTLHPYLILAIIAGVIILLVARRGRTRDAAAEVSKLREEHIRHEAQLEKFPNETSLDDLPDLEDIDDSDDPDD